MKETLRYLVLVSPDLCPTLAPFPLHVFLCTPALPSLSHLSHARDPNAQWDMEHIMVRGVGPHPELLGLCSELTQDSGIRVTPGSAQGLKLG